MQTAYVLGRPSRHVVILSNESDEDLCSWLPFARRLVGAGLQVMLYDYADTPVNDLAALEAYFRRHGATRVALVGASEGAKTSIVAAARSHPEPAAVVSLSAEADLLGQPVAPSAAKLTSPTLFVTAAMDPYDATSATRQFAKDAPARQKKLVVVPGSAHGTALLSRRQTVSTVLNWLTTHVA